MSTRLTVSKVIRTEPGPPAGAVLEDWLQWLETLHPRGIDLGLERVGRVAERLEITRLSVPLITVAGTNGKGSVVTMLESVYVHAGYRTGCYTSPHLIDFRERIRLSGAWADADDLIDAFQRIEAVRAPDTLTYFEYTTLAAVDLFIRSACDVVILEVGLGGRLDATNFWDADVAVLTSVALDHQDYLGNDRESIAREKVAIARPGRPLVLGEIDPPKSVDRFAREYGIAVHGVALDTGPNGSRESTVVVGATTVPGEPAELTDCLLKGPHQRRNAACARKVVELLQKALPVDEETVARGLREARIAGRFERRQLGELEIVLDVAHNPAGAEVLARTWQEHYPGQSAVMLYASLGDKDIEAAVRELAPIAGTWHLFAIDDSERAESLERLEVRVRRGLSGSDVDESVVIDTDVKAHASPGDAWNATLEDARRMDSPILICGSFHTIAAAYALLESS